MLSKRIQTISPSATLALNARAIELKKQGKDILKFGTGEPDCDTPGNIKDAAKRALDEGFTKYTAASGIPELKEAICAKFKRDNGIEYRAENILVTSGGKQALYNFFMAVLDENDEVIIPSPYWLSYRDMVNVCGGKVVPVDTRPTFKLTAEMVEKAINPRTKALILNSPSNPTGMVTEEEEIRKIAVLAARHGFMVVSDEVYEYFLYDGKKHFSIGSLPEMKEFSVTVNAVSKTYSMTGWRIGYIGGPFEIIKAMSTLQGHSTSNPCSIAQKAAVEALNGPQDSVSRMAADFLKRRNYVYEEMNNIPGFKLMKPEGAFYAFPDVSGAFRGSVNDSFKFSEFLLEEAGIVVVPGGAFGEEGNDYIRFSYASGMEDIEEGLRRIRKVLV